MPDLFDWAASAINEVEAEGREVRWVRVNPLVEPGDAWIGGILEGKLGEPATFARDREIVVASVDWFRAREPLVELVDLGVFDQEAKETLFGYEVTYG